MSCSRAVAESARGTDPSVERPRVTPIVGPGRVTRRSRVRAGDGPRRRTAVGDIDRRIGVRRGDATGVSSGARSPSSKVVPRERDRRRRDQPGEKHEHRQRLASRIDELRRFGALDDANLDAVLHRDLGRELPRVEDVEKRPRGTQRQLGRLRARKGGRGDGHHRRRSVDRGRHRGRGNRKSTVLQVLRP